MIGWSLTFNGRTYTEGDFADKNYAQTWAPFFQDVGTDMADKVTVAQGHANAAQLAADSIPHFTISIEPPPSTGQNGDIWYRVTP